MVCCDLGEGLLLYEKILPPTWRPVITFFICFFAFFLKFFNMLPYGDDLDKTSLDEHGSHHKDFEDMHGLVSY